MFNKFWGKFSKDLGIDLGTTNTRIFVKDKGIVINEPSVVAIHTRTNQILAVGREAKEMLGKTPPHVLTCKPLNKGVISDFEVTEKMLRYFIEKVHEDGIVLVPRPRVIIGVPLEITEVERKAIEDAVLSAGAREVKLVEKPMAAALGARLPVNEPVGNMIVDIGGGTTEVAVISLSGIVTWRSISVAGEELNKNIIQYARDVFNMLLGEKVAEQIKIQIGSASELPEKMEMEMRGRDMISGLPREVQINDGHVRESLARSMRIIIENIKSALEITPPDLVADIYERGMILTGGGSLLRGIDKAIAEATEIPVRIADDPLTCIVRGTGILLERPDLMKYVALPSAREESAVR